MITIFAEKINFYSILFYSSPTDFGSIDLRIKEFIDFLFVHFCERESIHV